MNVVLIGMKHCGKSTLGAALAARWQCPFHDVDPMIEATYECDAGEKLSVRQILEQQGEERFRELEGQVVCELYMKMEQTEESAVIALGGGTALNQRIRSLLSGIGMVIFLDVPPEELFKRIERGGLPPFLRGDDPFGRFMRIYNERRPIYESAADIVVDLGGTDIEEATRALSGRLGERTNAR